MWTGAWDKGGGEPLYSPWSLPEIPMKKSGNGRREWQPSPVFLPGESMGRGYWRATAHGVAELDMTQELRHTHTHTHTQETTANEKPFYPDVTRKESKREKGP